MSRPKGEKTKDLPPNLSIKKGIYYYTNPITGMSKSRGKNKALAVTEAIQANLEIYKPKESLIDWIRGTKEITLHEWLMTYQEIINKRELSSNSLRDYKIKISIIKRNLDDIPLKDITSKIIADFINGYPKQSMAKQIKSTLSDSFNEAIASGYVTINPVTVIKSPKIKVQRSRLTLEQFKKTLNNSPEIYKNIFLLSVLTGQRIGDMATLRWNDIKNDKIYIEQEKTGSKIAIPLDLKLSFFDLSIREVLNNLPRSSETICNSNTYTLRTRFSKYLPDCEKKPTFHEIRSLSARLYEEEKGAEFAKKLLGHKSMVMTDKYLDNRGNDYLEL